MKITDVEVVELRAPMPKGDWYDGAFVNCLIRLHTDAGITGIAEIDSSPAIMKAIIDPTRDSLAWPSLQSIVLGQDPTDPAALWAHMYALSHYYGRRGAAIHAISGIDIAAWDIKGKAEGKTAAELMGTPQRDRVRAYVTTSRLGETDDSVRRRLDTCLETGVRALKIASDPHWGREVDYACHVLALARAHVGKDIDLMFDAFACFKAAEAALGVVPVLKENGYLWFEAPIPMDDLDGFAEIAGQGMPVTGGDMGLTTRFEYEAMLVRGRADITQPDATMVGGLSEMLQVAEMAQGLGRRIIPHGYKSDILLATNLSFLAQHRDEEWLEYSIADSPLRWNMVHEAFPVGPDGKVAVPQGPGLGLTIDEETIARYRVD